MQHRDAKGAEGCGPVGDGEPGVVAGDQGAGNDEYKSRARSEDSEAVVRGIIRCGKSLQRFTPWWINSCRASLGSDIRERLSLRESYSK